MGRYNTVASTGVINTTATQATPTQGLLTTLTGTPPYTVTLTEPALCTGINQGFYNATGGVVTLSTPSGNILGGGFAALGSQTIPANSTYALVSDGINYIIVNNEGGPVSATTLSASGTVTLNPTSGNVNLNPANGNVVISPTGTGAVTINPATAGSINNVTIGGSTASTATFTTLTVNTSLTGNGTIDGGTF
jgi:hypothetical protein